MKRITGLLLAVFLHSLFFQTALARDERTALVPLPSLEDFTRGEDGWGFALGFGVKYESAYEGSDEFGFEVDPAGAVQWRRGDNILYWAGEALGWRVLRSDTWLLEAIVGFEEGREESDSDEGIEFALQARRAFDSDWRYWLDGRVIAGKNGNLGIFGVGRRFGERKDGSGSELSVTVLFHDSDYANKDFGITAAQAAASGLNETNMSGGSRSVGLHYN